MDSPSAAAATSSATCCMDSPSPNVFGLSGRVPCTATLAPSRHSSSAMTRPSPRDEPVTQATCPANGCSCSIVVSSICRLSGCRWRPLLTRPATVPKAAMLCSTKSRRIHTHGLRGESHRPRFRIQQPLPVVRTESAACCEPVQLHGPDGHLDRAPADQGRSGLVRYAARCPHRYRLRGVLCHLRYSDRALGGSGNAPHHRVPGHSRLVRHDRDVWHGPEFHPSDAGAVRRGRRRGRLRSAVPFIDLRLFSEGTARHRTGHSHLRRYARHRVRARVGRLYRRDLGLALGIPDARCARSAARDPDAADAARAHPGRSGRDGPGRAPAAAPRR